MEQNLAFDDLFGKFSQDIDEFQKTASIHQDINDEDFTQAFFTFIDSRDNNNNADDYPSQTESIINLIQQDFEEFERAELPPFQQHYDVTTKDETREMIDELMGHETSSWEFSITDDGNSNFYGNGNLLAYPSYGFGHGCVVRYFYCGETKKAKVNKPRKRSKRKYRGVKLSEKEAAKKMEENKLKNRETAAKAHNMKLAREARLHAIYQKLRQKNERLKKQIMFLEIHERINIPPKPLKRTISALV